MSYPDSAEHPDFDDQKSGRVAPWYRQPPVLIALVGAAVAIIAVGAALVITSGESSAPEPAGSTAPSATTSSSSLPAQPGSRERIATVPPQAPGQAPATSTVVLIPNPNGDGSMVPCEGTICTNPNHGAGDPSDPIPGPGYPARSAPYPTPGDAPPEPGQSTFSGPSPTAGPPEPGQTTFSGPSSSPANAPADGPPEPGQSTFSPAG
ncbi:hypothetical protein [Mycobacteroides franklinii]|uniref:hypothetical protein n=1 Tax=Mycobacteroides franklinii TaxID=948102 RepID=UPI001785AC58|nr:hypothetical protein [Mycobacteroides franklinii]